MVRLTPQIAARYFGCKVVVKGWDRDESDSPKMKMTALSENSICLGKNNNGIDMWAKIAQCVLVLDHLRDISVADANAVAAIATAWDRAAPLDPQDVPERLDEIMSGNCALTADYVSGSQVQQVIDYLRAHNYDMDNLIEQGVAVQPQSK